MTIEGGTAPIVLAYVLVSMGVIIASVGRVRDRMVRRSAARAPPRPARRRVTYASHPALARISRHVFCQVYTRSPSHIDVLR
jgi:hypothetical protein